jgi:hypothetical protein
MEPMEILAVVAAVVAGVLSVVLLCFKSKCTRLNVDKQALMMLRLFGVIELALLWLVAELVMPFVVFTVLDQLLLGYPGNKFVEMLAIIVWLLVERLRQICGCQYCGATGDCGATATEDV